MPISLDMNELAVGAVQIMETGLKYYQVFTCQSNIIVFIICWLSLQKKIGKPDPEVYVAEGGWKARQGGNGLEYAKTSVLTFEPCALQENTINFELQKPIDEGLYELFKPFGYLNRELGNKRLGEIYVTDKNGKLLLKLQGHIGSRTLKVSMLDKTAGHCNSFSALDKKI